ncbi:YkgJ family cysteine cluster protein [Pseudomonas putida]|nr:YkgJ family cysteine cluster protein [Pseudomonas putida]
MSVTMTQVSVLAADPAAPVSAAEATHQAQRNIALLNLDDTIDDPRYEFLEALRSGLPHRAMLNRLKKASDKINAAAMPRSACRSGCSHCCHISVLISQSEADAIGTSIGRKPRKLKERLPGVKVRDKWFKVPCTFLKKGRCSIYSERPLACRLMFNMSDTPYFCNTAIPPEESHVTMLDMRKLEEGYAKVFLKQDWGDVRDFFPPK